MNLGSANVFLTGGTGSFGSAFIQFLIETKNIPEKLTVYSRDWQKQQALREKLGDPSWIQWVIGDVRDLNRLKNVIHGHNLIIHAAAIKCIVACEKNATECLLTNVMGTQNVIDAIKCSSTFQTKAILISTDKAVHPINTYGTSKKMAEKLWVNAVTRLNSFAVCRYGNVIGSSGSVLQRYLSLIMDGVESLPVTDERMTRFWYPMQDAIKFVLDSLAKMKNNEVFIPKIPSIRIVDLVSALNMKYHIVGIRPGEKLHEYMIPPSDISNDPGYSSGNNEHFLTVFEIVKSIQEIKYV